MSLPDTAADNDGVLSAETVRQNTRDQSTKPGASRHGSGDASLDQGLGTTALGFVGEWGAHGTFVEVAFVALHTQLGRERRDVEPEEGTADDGHAGDDIDVADGHGEGCAR